MRRRYIPAIGLVTLSTACPAALPVLPSLPETTSGTSTGGAQTTIAEDHGDDSTGALGTGTSETSSTTASTTEDVESSSSSGEPLRCALGQGEACSPPDEAWWDSAWPYRRRVTVSSPLAAELTDAVVPIRLDETFEHDCASPEGIDLRVVDASGEAPVVLAHEIDEWEPGTGALLWVRLPSLLPGDRSLWIYYGNEAAEALEPEVWPTDLYAAVLHFGGDLEDSVGEHHGAPFDPRLAPQYNPDSPLGRSIHYEEVLLDARVELAETNAIDAAVVDSESLTLTAWLRSPPSVAMDSGLRVAVSRGSDFWSLSALDPDDYNFSPPGYAMFGTDCVTDECVCRLGECTPLVDGFNSHYQISNTPIIIGNTATWYHVAGVFQPLGGGDYLKQIYVNGAPAGETLGPIPMPWPEMMSDPNSITIGASIQQSSLYRYNGDIDELHISAAAWSPERIAAEHAFASDTDLVVIDPAQCS